MKVLHMGAFKSFNSSGDYRKKKGLLTAIVYDSIQDGFRGMEAIKKNPAMNATNKSRVEHTIYHGPNWTGCKDAAEFERRIKHGRTEGAERLQALTMKELNPVSIKRKRYRSDQGDELDIHEVNRGNLSQAWTRTKRERRAGAGKMITIVCNTGANAVVDAAKLFWRGAPVLKLTDALEAAGYQVKLVSIDGSAGPCTETAGAKEKVIHTAVVTVIKDIDAPLNVPDLAAIVAMPGYFRTVGFASIIGAVHETHSAAATCYSLGTHSDEITEHVSKELFGGDSMLIVQPEVNSQEAAQAWIDKVLQQIEGEE